MHHCDICHREIQPLEHSTTCIPCYDWALGQLDIIGQQMEMRWREIFRRVDEMLGR